MPGEVNQQSETFEREELVRALQARERFLTGVIGSLESFVTIDEDWRLTFANAAAERLAGLEHGDLVGKDIRDLAHAPALVQALPTAREGNAGEDRRRVRRERRGARGRLPRPRVSARRRRPRALRERRDGARAHRAGAARERAGAGGERGALPAALPGRVRRPAAHRPRERQGARGQRRRRGHVRLLGGGVRAAHRPRPLGGAGADS